MRIISCIITIIIVVLKSPISDLIYMFIYICYVHKCLQSKPTTRHLIQLDRWSKKPLLSSLQNFSVGSTPVSPPYLSLGGWFKIAQESIKNYQFRINSTSLHRGIVKSFRSCLACKIGDIQQFTVSFRMETP